MLKNTYSAKEARFFIFGVLGVIALFAIVIYININTPKFTTYSPDKKYSMAVFREISLSTLLKSGSFNMAKILLKDSNGKIIARLGSKDECKLEYSKVRTAWKPEENKAFINEQSYFELPNGKITCPNN